MRPAILAAMMGLAFASPALANNAGVKRVLTEAKLIGTWGLDCEAMASSTGWEQIIVDDRGGVQSIDGGDDSISVYDIVEAERIDATHLRMKMVLVPDEELEGEGEDGGANVLTVVYRVEADRQMTWSSVTSAGVALITDGVFHDGETRSQWYLRCPKGIPAP